MFFLHKKTLLPLQNNLFSITKSFIFLKKKEVSHHKQIVFSVTKTFFSVKTKKVLGVKTKEKVKELAHMEEQEG